MTHLNTTHPFTLERATSIATELTTITGEAWQAQAYRVDRHTLTNRTDCLSIGDDGQIMGLLKTYGLYRHNGGSVRPSLPGPCATLPAWFTHQAIAQDIVTRLLRVYRFYLALAVAESKTTYQNGSRLAIQSRQHLIRDQFDRGNIPEPLDEALDVIAELYSY